MAGMRDYFPWHAWAVVIALSLIAAAGVFIPPTAGSEIGLTAVEHVFVVGAVELGCALAIAAIVLYYQTPEGEQEDDDESEWRFSP